MWGASVLLAVGLPLPLELHFVEFFSGHFAPTLDEKKLAAVVQEFVGALSRDPTAMPTRTEPALTLTSTVPLTRPTTTDPAATLRASRSTSSTRASGAGNAGAFNVPASMLARLNTTGETSLAFAAP